MKNERTNNKRRFPRTSTPSPERVIANAKKNQDQNTLVQEFGSLGVENSTNFLKAPKIARMQPENLEFEAIFNPTNNWSISPLTSTAENSFNSEEEQNNNDSFQIYDDNFQLNESENNGEGLGMSPELVKLNNKNNFGGIGRNDFLNKAVTEIDPEDLISDEEF